MTHTIIKWQCLTCKDIVTSKSKERHTMNYCKCKKIACDLEEHCCRWIGLPDKKEKERLKNMILSIEKELKEETK